MTITDRLAALHLSDKCKALDARLVLAVELLRTCGNGEMTSEDYRDVELFLAHIDKERKP